MNMDELIQKFWGHVAFLIAGAIFTKVRKLFKDLNASFRKIRELEERVKTLEKEKEDGSGK